MSVVHYVGSITIPGDTLDMLIEWIACCTGMRASRIRDKGNVTHKAEAVTCKRCLKMIAACEKKKVTHDRLNY